MPEERLEQGGPGPGLEGRLEVQSEAVRVGLDHAVRVLLLRS